MKTPLTILCSLLLTCLFAQNATTVQPKYFSAFKLAERLPGGELVTVHQSGKNKFLSYPTLTVTSATGDTLWSITDEDGSGGEIFNIVPLTDTSFVAHGYVHECDISGGSIKVYNTVTGEESDETGAWSFFEDYLPRTRAGVRLSGGNFLLLEPYLTAVFSPDFSTISRTNSNLEPNLCDNSYRSAVPGPDNNLILIRSFNSPANECPPHLKEVQLVSVDSNRAEVQFLSGPYLPGSALDIIQADTFTYLLSDLMLIKGDRDFQAVAYRELTNNATDAMMDFANGELFVLSLANNRYEVTRYTSADLAPMDTISLDYVPGLTYNDFFVSGDSIYAFGELLGYSDGQYFGQFIDNVAVRTVTPIGQSMALPVTDLRLDALASGEVTFHSLDSRCGNVCQNGLYSAKYSGLMVRITNAGSVPITNFYLHTQVPARCDCFSFCGISELWRQRFVGLSVAPGEEITLALDDVFISNRLGEYQLCLWAANINSGLDVDHTNNVACYDFVNRTLERALPVHFDLYPDRSAGFLNLRTESNEDFNVEVFDVNGRLVGAAAGAGEVGVRMPKPRGVYFVAIIDGSGRSRTYKLVW